MYNRNHDPLFGEFLPSKNFIIDCTGFLISCHKNYTDIAKLLLEKYPHVIH